MAMKARSMLESSASKPGEFSLGTVDAPRISSRVKDVPHAVPPPPCHQRKSGAVWISMDDALCEEGQSLSCTQVSKSGSLPVSLPSSAVQGHCATQQLSPSGSLVGDDKRLDNRFGTSVTVDGPGGKRVTKPDWEVNCGRSRQGAVPATDHLGKRANSRIKSVIRRKVSRVLPRIDAVVQLVLLFLALPVVVCQVVDIKASLGQNSGVTCVLLSTSAVRCWGSNQFGQLGDGTTTHSSGPSGTSTAENAVAVSTSGQHTCIVTSLSGVRCWGRGDYGALGYLTGMVNPVVPDTDLSGVAGVTRLTTGSMLGCQF
jgi:hypothetical protein